MQWIDIYNIRLERIGMLLTWISLLWEDCYNTLGNFQLEVQQTDENSKLLKPWTYFKLNNNDRPMIATSIQLKDKKIIVRGYPATYILQKRVSDLEISNTNAEKAMFQLINNMSPWENFFTGSIKGIDSKYKNQISDKSILEYCQTIAQETDIGFYVRKQKNNLLFECYKPELNPNIKTAERYGNLANLIYNVNENNHYNVAIVAGMAVDNTEIKKYYERIYFNVELNSTYLFVTYDDSTVGFSAELEDGNIIITVPDSQYGYVKFSNTGDLILQILDRYTIEAGETDSLGYLRREIYVDARDIQLNENDGETISQYAERLKLRGLAKLSELLKIENIEFDIDDERAKLGDLISITIPEFKVKTISRIISDKYKSQNNYLQRTIKVGTAINLLSLTNLRGIRI